MTNPNYEAPPKESIPPRWQESRNKFAIPGALTPEQAREKDADGKLEGTVTMVFPHAVLLTRQNMSRVSFPAGVNEVPASLADHWYLKANYVQRHQKPEDKEDDAPAQAKAADDKDPPPTQVKTTDDSGDKSPPKPAKGGK